MQRALRYAVLVLKIDKALGMRAVSYIQKQIEGSGYAAIEPRRPLVAGRGDGLRLVVFAGAWLPSRSRCIRPQIHQKSSFAPGSTCQIVGAINARCGPTRVMK
ncbi:hypothetical protein LCM4579_11450 [Ensifer sp. LCM 4579]|nr:hypothetical protein LCM4579_11450 [Ensifer sp. LCM 4579]